MDMLVNIQQNYSTTAPGLSSAAPQSKLHDNICNNSAEYVDRVSHAVLVELHYPEMTHRNERIALAHQKTFEWIFEPPEEPERWSDFAKWIQCHDQALYWITGKPGAGKSTLMRFLIDHTRTNELLSNWSTDRELLKVCFFWNSGTRMQMSYEGLLRSLLYQILNRVPQLILIAFPHRVSDGLLLGDFIFRGQDWLWSWDELLKLTSSSSSKQRKPTRWSSSLTEWTSFTASHLI